MRRKLLANGFGVSALILVVALAATTPARAGQLLAFDYSMPANGATGMDVSASGFFATTDWSGGSAAILGAWGTWNGATITGLTVPGTIGTTNDNLLFSSDPLLDFNGVGFTVSGLGDDGFGNVNVYYDAAQLGYTEASTKVGLGAFSLSPVTTPSPAYFDFSYSIPGAMDVSASGMLAAFNVYSDNYFVSDISGIWNGIPILGLLPPGTYGGNDNVLFGASPHLTINGLSFAVSGGVGGDDGSGNVNVAYYSYWEGYSELSDAVGVTPNFDLSQTPEPASVTLLCTGIPFVLFLVRRRSRAPRRPEQA